MHGITLAGLLSDFHQRAEAPNFPPRWFILLFIRSFLAHIFLPIDPWKTPEFRHKTFLLDCPSDATLGSRGPAGSEKSAAGVVCIRSGCIFSVFMACFKL